MKKYLLTMSLIFLVVLFPGCNSERNITETTEASYSSSNNIETETIDDLETPPIEEELSNYYDAEKIDFDEAVKNSYSLVVAKCEKLISSDTEARDYWFSVEKVISGEAMPDTFTLTVSEGMYGVEGEKSYASTEIDYVENRSYLIPLEKYISVFYDADQYFSAANTQIELNNGKFVSPKIQGRDITEYADVDAVVEKGLTCGGEAIGVGYTLSEDLTEIAEYSEYILEVEVSEVSYNRADSKTTYRCNVLEIIKSKNNNLRNLQAVLPKDCAKPGGKYLLMLNRAGEDSYIFVVSSKNNSVHKCGSEESETIKNFILS